MDWFIRLFWAKEESPVLRPKKEILQEQLSKLEGRFNAEVRPKYDLDALCLNDRSQDIGVAFIAILGELQKYLDAYNYSPNFEPSITNYLSQLGLLLESLESCYKGTPLDFTDSGRDRARYRIKGFYDTFSGLYAKLHKEVSEKVLEPFTQISTPAFDYQSISHDPVMGFREITLQILNKLSNPYGIHVQEVWEEISADRSVLDYRFSSEENPAYGVGRCCLLGKFYYSDYWKKYFLQGSDLDDPHSANLLSIDFLSAQTYEITQSGMCRFSSTAQGHRALARDWLLNMVLRDLVADAMGTMRIAYP